MTGITAINLLPAPYQLARRQRRLLRRSIVAAAGYLAIVVIGSIATVAWCSGGNGRAEQLLIEAELTRNQQAAATEELALNEAERKLAAAQTLSRQPDWSLLTRIVGAQVASDAVLTELRLDTPKGDGSEPSAGSREVILRGVAHSYAAASNLVLRMEQLKLFDSVLLEKTDREPIATGEGVSFRIRCVLGGGAS